MVSIRAGAFLSNFLFRDQLIVGACSLRGYHFVVSIELFRQYVFLVLEVRSCGVAALVHLACSLVCSQLSPQSLLSLDATQALTNLLFPLWCEICNSTVSVIRLSVQSLETFLSVFWFTFLPRSLSNPSLQFHSIHAQTFEGCLHSGINIYIVFCADGFHPMCPSSNGRKLA